MTSLKKWIGIRDYFLKYNNFSNVEEIGKGGFGTIYKADYNGKKVALKSLSEEEDCFKELKILDKVSVHLHPNINQFLGVTKDQIHENYIIVLQYANQGNLREYLKKYFHSLQWKDMIRMALDITCGLKFLHSKQIIHRDLHAKNILVNNGSLMIADFGLSKHLDEIRSDSAVLGMPAYIDPQCYINNEYKQNKKSDIYSLGILLWEISSGKPPFSEIPIFKISLDIVNGIGETPVNNTPFEYNQLYENCWKKDPDQRPDIDKVYRFLSQLKLQFDNGEQIKVITGIETKNLSGRDNNNNYSSMESSYCDSNLKNLFLPP